MGSLDPAGDRETWVRRASGLFAPGDLAGGGPAAGGPGADGPGLGGSGAGAGAPRPAAGVVNDLAPYLVGAVPFLVPLLAVAVLGDPAVLRVLLWQGNLVALFVAMLSAFLPLVVGSAVFVVVHRFSYRGRFSAAALPAAAAAGLVMVFTPLTFAIAQFAILVGVLLALRPPDRSRLANRPQSPARLRLRAGLQSRLRLRAGRRLRAWPPPVPGRWLAVGAVLVVPALTLLVYSRGYLGTDPKAMSQATASRILYGLPRELAVRSDGTVTVYYLVAADERFTTVVHARQGVQSIRTADIAVRLPCRHHQQGGERSLASLVLSWPPFGNTPYCEDVASCLNAWPRPAATDPDARDDQAAVADCVRAATGQP